MGILKRKVEFSALDRFELQIESDDDDPQNEQLLKNEKDINKKLTEGDFNEISDAVTPNGLTVCSTNSLELSLEVSHKLIRLAKSQTGPDGEDLTSLSLSVQDFAFHLLDPLRTDDKKRQIFENNFDSVADTSLSFHAKKFISHPVVYNLLMRQWKGPYHELSIKSCETFCGWFTWMLLNIWVIFDMVLFPVIFAMLYLYHVISKKIQGPGPGQRQSLDLYERYKRCFQTPYFVFLRDTLSYLALLLLHFAVCVQPTGLRFSVLEWIIMVFFIGRILMEIDQVIKEKNFVDDAADKKSPRCACGRFRLFKKLSNYFSDVWNKLDVVTIVIYIFLFTLRIVTWKVYATGSNKRLVAIGAYLYGLNALLLTMRVFGQIMESRKSMGTIQIALLKIIGAIIVIGGQVVACLFAFSVAITKIYLAEITFSGTTNSSSHGLCKTQEGIKCWWLYFEHLAWSLVGSGGTDVMASSDSVSDYIAKSLYMAFLVIAVVLIMNMLIALLTNTYQKVEDNAFHEWSFKKAMAVRTYARYHSIPVPFNIISLFVVFLCRVCCKAKCCVKRPKYEEGDTQTLKQFRCLIKDLESEYFAEYGYSYPITDAIKLDRVLWETEGNRDLTGHIAENVFKHDVKSNDSANWDCAGVCVDGQRLFYTSCNRPCCSNNDPRKDHGARYRHCLSEQQPGFEVLIKESGKKRYLAIGVVEKDYNLHKFPGWRDNSVGYHVDDGKIYDEENRGGKETAEDSLAFRGDLLGCEVLFGQKSEHKLPVRFTLNGRKVGDGVLSVGGQSRPVHAFIAIGDPEISVLFRMRSNISTDVNTTQLNDLSDQVVTLSRNVFVLHQEVAFLSEQMLRFMSGAHYQPSAIPKPVPPARPPAKLSNNVVIKVAAGAGITRQTVTALRTYLMDTNMIYEEPSGVRDEDLITITNDPVETKNCWVARRRGKVIVPPIGIGQEEVMAGNLGRLLRYQVALEKAQSPWNESELLKNIDFRVMKIENVKPYHSKNIRNMRINEGLEKGIDISEGSEHPASLKSHLLEEETGNLIGRTGDAFVCQVSNNDDKQHVFISVLLYQMDGSVKVIDDLCGEKLESGSSVEIIRRVSLPVNDLRIMVQPDLSLPEPNMGIDTLVVYATSKPIDFKPLVQTAMETDPNLTEGENEKEDQGLSDFQDFVKPLKKLSGMVSSNAEGFQWMVKKIQLEITKHPPHPPTLAQEEPTTPF